MIRLSVSQTNIINTRHLLKIELFYKILDSKEKNEYA